MGFLLSEPDTCTQLCISAQLPMLPIIKHCWQIYQHTECRNQGQTQTLLHTWIQSLTSTYMKREWPLGTKTGCTLNLRLRSKAELVFHASRRKLGWAGRRGVRDSLHVLSRIRNESPIDEHFSGKDTQCGLQGMSWLPLTSEQAPVVASHTHSSDWFWTRFNQRTVRRVLLIQLTIEM